MFFYDFISLSNRKNYSTLYFYTSIYLRIYISVYLYFCASIFIIKIPGASLQRGNC